VSTPPSELSLNSFTAGGPPFTQGPPIKAHLVHLLPARPRNSMANRVLHSIETFLLSFQFPISLGMGAQKPGASELPRTCLLEAAAFSEPVAAPSSLGTATTTTTTWSIAEVLLSGCLDDEPIPRVWLSGASDIVISASPAESRLPPAAVEAAVHAANPRPSTSSAPSPAPSADLGGPNGQRMQAVSLDDSSCHAGLVRETTTMKGGKRSWLWRFWKRRIVMAPMSR
jgi:hypothetical protein